MGSFGVGPKQQAGVPAKHQHASKVLEEAADSRMGVLWVIVSPAAMHMMMTLVFTT